MNTVLTFAIQLPGRHKQTLDAFVTILYRQNTLIHQQQSPLNLTETSSRRRRISMDKSIT